VSDPIRLYTYVMSPFAAKVHCFLLYKRLEFECFYVNPLRVRKDLPVGHQIPALTVGGESRADSSPIGLWLDELFPDRPRLLPEAGEERKRLLAVDDWITSHLIPGSFRSYPGAGINRVLNAWKLSHVMANTARGGLPWMLRGAWPIVIHRVAFVRRLVAQADNGLPVREAKLKLYDEFALHLHGGPFVLGRDAPSMPDLAAYPQFALYYATGFRGGDDILERPELMAWLGRMRPFVSGDPPVVPRVVRQRELPGAGTQARESTSQAPKARAASRQASEAVVPAGSARRRPHNLR
jgi:glutathione S-transferase